MDYYWVKKIVNPFSDITPGIILVEEGSIAALSKKPSGLKITEKYEYAIPGFVDIHTHGLAGFDIMDGTKKSLSALAKSHLKAGTTSFLGTTLTAPLPKLGRIIKKGRDYLEANQKRALSGKEADILGFHLEGPWISVPNSCAHNPKHIIGPGSDSESFVEENADCIRMITMDYQGRKSDSFLQTLKNSGIIAACGHDDSRDTLIQRGFKKGISHVTHIYCCTSHFHKRGIDKHLGVAEMALMTEGITVEVIADNHHITRPIWEFITHNKPLEEVIVVSDSIRAAGLPRDREQKLMLEGMEISIRDGVALLPDGSGFAGSVTSLYEMFLILVKKWKVSMQDAVRVTSYNPAKKLGLETQIGEIRRGNAADILFLDKNLVITKILKNGIVVK